MKSTLHKTYCSKIGYYLKNLFHLIPVTLIIGLLLAGCSRRSGDAPDYIAQLDDAIDNSQQYEEVKTEGINELKRQLSGATTPAHRYLLTAMLFGEYSTFNSDSALKYIDLSLRLARQSGNNENVYRSLLQKADYLTGTGLLNEARAMMDSINKDELPDALLPDYYGNMIYLYSHLGNYAGGNDNHFYQKERAYKDSIMGVIQRDNPAWLWYSGLDILGTDKDPSEIISQLREKLEAPGHRDSRQAAMDAYILAKLYEQEGDMENYRKYMAHSARIDVSISNMRELSSLEELASIMYQGGNGDIDRAYKYINYCLNRAIAYPNRVKAVGISERLASISQAFLERNMRQEQITRGFLIAICILAAVLGFTIFVIIRQFRRLKHQSEDLKESNDSLHDNIIELKELHQNLNEANERLKQLVEDLKEKNEDLNESNYVKEEYIGYVFSICSKYINHLSELKKLIHVQMLKKNYDLVYKETEDFDMRSDLKEFYNSFDTVFLHIYPDFVDDFNSLLEPDKHIVPKEGELLNTELRIYALIRLGITDSVKIAEFLHCSPQTIYNNRFKVRNKSVIPKDEFISKVKRLGSYAKAGT